MRIFVRLVACVGIALTAAGCDPVTERRYITEGAGVDLYTQDRTSQIQLQNLYIDFVCRQAGSACSCPATDDGSACIVLNWPVFVQAGMNDIDLRCDSFLTWLDARRRDKEPVLNEISALSTATHSIMMVTAASQKSLGIVVAAFGLATDTYTNWNSRLLLAINQSTVQEVVYTSQGKLRDRISTFRIADRPTSIYLLRNYLRLCMPTTIEAAVNISATLVQRDVPVDAQENLVVGNVMPPTPAARPTIIRTTIVSDDARVALTKFVYPNGELAARDAAAAKQVSDFMAQKKINVSITMFLKSPNFATDRAALARQLGLVQ